jgi:hypothetical protein
MTPQEKAKELFNKFDFIYSYDGLDIMDEEFTKEDRKQCALIAVDEILEMDLPILEEDADKFYDYWQEVKHEIEKL